MSQVRRNKSDFNYDEQGRAILGSAEDMATWVELGFYEQDLREEPDFPFQSKFIDLRNCVLYVSYPIGSSDVKSKIFNLCDLAGIVPGIEKVEGNPDCLFNVTLDIRFDGSELYGNFFHYVKFSGMVNMDNAIVRGLFSCFKCQFCGFVYMQRIHLDGGFVYEQCDFSKGLNMAGAVVEGIDAKFNYCIFKKRLFLAATSFKNGGKKDYQQSISFTNSSVENLYLSKLETDGIPIFFQDTSIDGMHVDNINLNSSIFFNSCYLDGILTFVKDEKGPDNYIKEVEFHSCDVKAQYYIEYSRIDKFSILFGRIEDSGRIRMLKCKIDELSLLSLSVAGQMEILESKIPAIDLDGSIVNGHLLFQDNIVKEYANRQTVRLLKNEAIKVNDDVNELHLYAKEMRLLLKDKSVYWPDKWSLRINQLFSNFGENWIQAASITLALSAVLTLFMLGVGSSKYIFNPVGDFIGIGHFVTIWLDSINVFSIPLFSDTVKEYGLNVGGQILYFIIKMVVAYGSYQFIVSFKKYGRH